MEAPSLDPLESAREAALQLLARLTLWLWTPTFAIGLLARWNEVPTRPMILLVLGVLPLLGMTLRQQRWSSERRARLAVLMALALSVLPLLYNGPRSVNTMAIAVVVTMAMLFWGSRVAFSLLIGYVATVVLHLALVSRGVLAPRLDESALPMLYRVVAAGVTMSGLGFAATVLQRTIRIYRDAQAASEQRLQAMLEAQQEAEVLQRRELVNVVTTGMTHDFANIVQVVGGTAELLELEPLTDEGRIAVRDLRRVADDATTRLRTILSVGRTTASAQRFARPDELFARLDLLLPSLMGRRTRVTLTNSITRPIAIDGGRLEQVLINLAVNARDAMPGGGALHIRATSESTLARIDVSDTGVGIPEAVQRHMWEPFFTTKADERGTGLGLAMVARILESARGRVAVESREGHGTTFTVWLPLVTTDEMRTETTTADSSTADAKGTDAAPPRIPSAV